MTTRIASVDAHEGPVHVAEENALYFTSVPHRNGDQSPPVEGERLGQIPVPGAVNFAFGDGALFITNDAAVWKAELEGDFAWEQ